MDGTWQQPTQAPTSQPPPPPSTTATGSTLHPAREEVLQDRNLLGEVLAFLPTPMDCLSASLVNHHWYASMEAADPWQYLLLARCPHVHPFLRSLSPTPVAAKHLLPIYSRDPDDGELNRLNELFRHKAVIVEVRHPEHGVVASCHLPIHGKAYKHFLDHEHPLTIHASAHLPIEEYGRCTTVVRMPVNVDFITCSGYAEQNKEDIRETWDAVNVRWKLWPHDHDSLNGKFTGFLQDVGNFCGFWIVLSFTCAYSRDIEEDQMLAAEPKGLKGTVQLTMSEYSFQCELQYLYLLESWSVAVTHMRPDALVEPLLRRLFQDTYMLIEVKAANTSWPYEAEDLHAFALVPLWDEAALMSLFQEQITPLFFVNKGNELPQEDDRRIYVSFLDLSKHREMQLSVKRGNREVDSYCHLFAVGQSANFEASISPDHQAGNTSQAFSVKLEVELFVHDWNEQGMYHPASVLNLWTFLSICMARGDGI